jgi:hypothetical protein
MSVNKLTSPKIITCLGIFFRIGFPIIINNLKVKIIVIRLSRYILEKKSLNEIT